MIDGVEVGLVRGCESWLHDIGSCALEYIGFLEEGLQLYDHDGRVDSLIPGHATIVSPQTSDAFISV
jgi:hypothetical protein